MYVVEKNIDHICRNSALINLFQTWVKTGSLFEFLKCIIFENFVHGQKISLKYIFYWAFHMSIISLLVHICLMQNHGTYFLMGPLDHVSNFFHTLIVEEFLFTIIMLHAVHSSCCWAKWSLVRSIFTLHINLLPCYQVFLFLYYN